MVPLGNEIVTSGQVPSEGNISGNVLPSIDSIFSLTHAMNGRLKEKKRW